MAIIFSSIGANNTFTTITPDTANLTHQTYSNLTAGSYIIGAFFTSPGSITYQSDSYTCPSYITTYPDVMNIFQACPATTTTTTTDSVPEDNSARNIALIVGPIVRRFDQEICRWYIYCRSSCQ